MRNQLRLLAVAPLLVSVVACTTPGPAQYQIRSVDRYAARSQNSGLSAGAEALDTYRKSTAALGFNATAEFTPIELVVENGAPAKVLVQRDSAKLLCADGTTLAPVGGIAMYQQYRQSGVPAALLGFHWAAAATTDDNEQLKLTLTQREFPAASILTQGQRGGGLLYFRGKCAERMGRKLHIIADHVASPDTVTLAMDLR
jgi:hypothetical protein